MGWTGSGGVGGGAGRVDDGQADTQRGIRKVWDARWYRPLTSAGQCAYCVVESGVVQNVTTTI